MRTRKDCCGVTYAVLPCFVNGDSRIRYCGAYTAAENSWQRVMDLSPKESEAIAWEDLNAYLDARAEAHNG